MPDWLARAYMFSCWAMRAFRPALTAFLWLIPSLLSSPAHSQTDVSGNDLTGVGSLNELSVAHYRTDPYTGVLVFTVFNERKGARLDRQALLKLVNVGTQTATWQTTGDSSEGVFTSIPWGNYTVEVSAVGYLSAHQEVQVAAVPVEHRFEIVLKRDPAGVNFDVGNSFLSPKVRKQTKAAISALKSGRLDDAQKHLSEAYRVSPSDPSLNFLLGYLYFQKKDYSQATTYLDTATSLNPHNPQALTLLGCAGLERSDYPAARSALEQAVLADADNWLPHNLLADTYLHEKQFDKARDEAQVAITKGKNMASSAQLILGEALVSMGHDSEGIDALNTFLQQRPQQPLAGQVRELIAEVNDRSSASAAATSSLTQPRFSGVDPLSALPPAHLSLTAWQPPGVDEVKPAVAPGVSCPAEKVIEESGKRVQEFIEDVTRFAAVEDLFHQALDEYGAPVHTETRKFNYVASISEPEPGILLADEYRAEKLTADGFPGNIASTGLAALALVFHPHMRDNFELSCEGLGDWRGQASWLVHFRQRDNRPSRLRAYKVGGQFHSVDLKGRAWITADKFQIVRIEAEMVKPMPEIQLLTDHQLVEYGPVRFEKKNVSLWLPKNAEVYFDFRKRRYYRRHSFDHFMLFSTDTEEKRKEPVAPLAKEKKS